MAKSLKLRSVLKGQRTFEFFDSIPSSEGDGSAARRSAPCQERFAMTRQEPDKSLIRFCGTVGSTIVGLFRRRPKSRTTPYLI